MPVRFSALGGAGNQLTFSDSFTRANKSTLGTNWIRTLANTPGGGGNGGTATAEISTNQALFNVTAGAGATQAYMAAWIPLPVYFNLFSQAGMFVQCRFQQDVGAGSCGLGLRYNHNMNNTITQTEGTDIYYCLMKGAAAGRIDKIVGGGGVSTVGASTWGALTANDLIRFEVLTSGTSVFLQTIRNGAVLQTVNENSATRILEGGPCVFFQAPNISGQQLLITEFSCGPISVLS